MRQCVLKEIGEHVTSSKNLRLDIIYYLRMTGHFREIKTQDAEADLELWNQWIWVYILGAPPGFVQYWVRF